MPLPYFNQNVGTHIFTEIEPIFKNTFDVTFIDTNLSKKDLEILHYHIMGMTHNLLNFNINDNHKLTKVLLKLKKFSLELSSFNKEGHLIAHYVIRDCKIKNIEKYIIDFNYNSSDILEYYIPIKYKEIKFYDKEEFKNYLRFKKLNKILKN